MLQQGPLKLFVFSTKVTMKQNTRNKTMEPNQARQHSLLQVKVSFQRTK